MCKFVRIFAVPALALFLKAYLVSVEIVGILLVTVTCLRRQADKAISDFNFLLTCGICIILDV